MKEISLYEIETRQEVRLVLLNKKKQNLSQAFKRKANSEMISFSTNLLVSRFYVQKTIFLFFYFSLFASSVIWPIKLLFIEGNLKIIENFVR